MLLVSRMVRMAGLGTGDGSGMAQLVRWPQHKREDGLQHPGENLGAEAHMSLIPGLGPEGQGILRT